MMNEILHENAPQAPVEAIPAAPKRKSITGWVALFAVLLVVGLIWTSMDLTISQELAGTVPMNVDNANTSPEVGAFAPDFSLISLDGEELRLSDYRGKPVIVNFWATWCPPCRAEMPALEEIWTQYDENVVILGVDQGESPQLVAHFTRVQVPVTFPILLDIDHSIGDGYWVRSLPTTFFIDPDGVIQDIHIGGPLTVDFLHEKIASLTE
ncbi:redoxin domain-containing protein [bacterium]|nr:redoxin domain-containing protein [bacterium]